MNNVTIAVDLAKNVFELAVANVARRITERRRLSRAQFERFWTDRLPCRVVLEACASAHFWGRWLRGRGFTVVLLPPHYVRPYVRRNKTDRTDCEALLETLRCAGIHPVSLKSEDQQAILALHRVRSQWMATRTARINVMRGLLRGVRGNGCHGRGALSARAAGAAGRQQRATAGAPLTRLQEWAVEKARAQHFNAAAVALARSPVHASRAASQDGAHPLGALDARAPLRRQVPSAGGAAGRLTRHPPVHPRWCSGSGATASTCSEVTGSASKWFAARLSGHSSAGGRSNTSFPVPTLMTISHRLTTLTTTRSAGLPIRSGCGPAQPRVVVDEPEKCMRIEQQRHRSQIVVELFRRGIKVVCHVNLPTRAAGAPRSATRWQRNDLGHCFTPARQHHLTRARRLLHQRGELGRGLGQVDCRHSHTHLHSIGTGG